MAQTMKAAVVRQFRAPLTIEEVAFQLLERDRFSRDAKAALTAGQFVNGLRGAGEREEVSRPADLLPFHEHACHSQPPVNPALRSPITMGPHRRIMSQSKPVR